MNSLSKDHKPIQLIATPALTHETQVAVQTAQQPPTHLLPTPHHVALIQRGIPEQEAAVLLQELALADPPPPEHLLPAPHHLDPIQHGPLEPQAVVPLRELAPAAPLQQEAVLAALPPQAAAEPQAVPLPQEPAAVQTHAETHHNTTHCTNNSS